MTTPHWGGGEYWQGENEQKGTTASRRRQAQRAGILQMTYAAGRPFTPAHSEGDGSRSRQGRRALPGTGQLNSQSAYGLSGGSGAASGTMASV